MKKLMKQMSLFLALGTFMFSCSVDRNALTRGGESSYGLGGGIAVANKSPRKLSEKHETIALPIAAETPTNTVSSSAGEMNVNAIDNFKPEVQINNNIAVSSMISTIAGSSLNKIIRSESSFKTPFVAKATKGDSKSWYLTLFLCVFFGVLGAHRFYLGYTWQGLVQLFTLGGLGIWWLIDLVRIILKKLEPRCGIYEDI